MLPSADKRKIIKKGASAVKKKKICMLAAAVTAVIMTACAVFGAMKLTVSGSSATSSAASPRKGEPLGSSSKSAASADSGSSDAASSGISSPDIVTYEDGEKGELRGMWITYFELANMFTAKEGFDAAFGKALDKSLEYGVNAAFVHVRSHADAYYPSNSFPWSKYVTGHTGKQGTDPGFDPLERMITLCHERGIEFHAWVNPYRVTFDSEDLTLLSNDNQAKIWLTDGDESNDSWIIHAKGGLYFNPAVPEVQSYIIDGVREIVQSYNVDGIHFDDYFYPSRDESIDEKEYAAYRASVHGTPLELADWRRANVNVLVSSVYYAIKSCNRKCVFGISPMASIGNNFVTVYADCKAWLDGDYIDYIMPQLYFGFEYPKESSRFDRLLDEWEELFSGRRQKLYIGLGAYRIGATDENNVEWSEHDDMLARQIQCIREGGGSDGFVFYSYTSFFADDERHIAERKAVTDILQQ